MEPGATTPGGVPPRLPAGSHPHDPDGLGRFDVDPSYWPRAMKLRLFIAASYVVLVPAGLIPMSNTWWLISGGTLLLYSAAMYAIYLRFGVLRWYEELSPYADTLVVTLAIVALGRPGYPIWMGYFLIIPALANFHSTKYMLVFSLWTVVAYWSGLVILEAQGRAGISWQYPTIVSIMAVFMAANADIISTSNRNLREMVMRASVTDPLTGLANRRLMQAMLLAHATEPTRPLAVLMFDVDNFKRLNEERGHVEADTVLVRIAAELRECFPEAHVVARFGGDEMVALTHVNTVEEAVQLGERSLERVRQRVGVHLSAGVGVYPLTAATPEAAVNDADVALGAAKRGGKARIATSALRPVAA